MAEEVSMFVNANPEGLVGKLGTKPSIVRDVEGATEKKIQSGRV